MDGNIEKLQPERPDENQSDMKLVDPHAKLTPHEHDVYSSLLLVMSGQEPDPDTLRRALSPDNGDSEINN